MIDTHVHLWRLGENGCTWPTPDLAPIYRDHLLPEVAGIAAAAGVSGVVLVQSQEDVADTEWLLAQAAGSPLVAGVVGWADLTGDAAAELDRLAARGPLKGVRIMAQDHDADFPLRHRLGPLAERGLSLDLLIRPKHLGACETLARAYPAVRMIVDHCAKPVLSDEGLRDWRERIAALADRPNLWCKLSGLLTELANGQSPEQALRCAEIAVALFGPERLIWGSDWPVLNCAADYAGWLGLARAAIPAAHHQAVFGDNARTFYRLA